MLIAQISDTHITAPGTRAYGVAAMAENLSRCIERINHFSPRPDVTLVTGDVSQSGALEELEYASLILGELKMPYYVIPGNHDDRAGMWSTFGGQACPGRTGGFIQYVVEDFPVRLIAMDSTVPGKPGGEICASRADWLDARLAEDDSRPTLIFIHHPPVKCGVIETDIDGFEGAGRFGDVIEKYSNVENVVCGHIHVAAHTRWRGTVVSTAPSIGMQLVLDLSLKCDEFTLVDAAYQLHYWTEDKNMVTHSQSVNRGVGPYPFKELPIQADKQF